MCFWCLQVYKFLTPRKPIQSPHQPTRIYILWCLKGVDTIAHVSISEGNNHPPPPSTHGSPSPSKDLSQQDIDPILGQCWATFYDAGPALTPYLLYDSCFLHGRLPCCPLWSEGGCLLWFSQRPQHITHTHTLPSLPHTHPSGYRPTVPFQLVRIAISWCHYLQVTIYCTYRQNYCKLFSVNYHPIVLKFADPIV